MEPHFTHVRTLYSECPYFTPGKLYKIEKLDEYTRRDVCCFWIVNDEGRSTYCCSKKCLHLDGMDDWEMVDAFEENLKQVLE